MGESIPSITRTLVKYRRGKKNEDDAGGLVGGQLLIVPRVLRRVPLQAILHHLIFTLITIYLLMILRPVQNLCAFLPADIQTSRNFLVVVAHPDDEYVSSSVRRSLDLRRVARLVIWLSSPRLTVSIWVPFERSN